ncbi:MAG TPA: threonine synthase [Aliidongia sp.]|nr:threonine synthase [Aliidongia sp.]
MRYISTRQPAGNRETLGFEEVLIAGLAPDGGLYVPTELPVFSAAEMRRFRALSYPELAAEVLVPFVGDAFHRDELLAILEDAYAGFDHRAVAPLKQLGSGEFLLELFHGPTIAFKDYALQVLGRLFDAVLARHGRRATIVGATSGDTGSAAIEACRDRDNIDIFILYPRGRTSAVQRRQMTTVQAPNVRTLAVEGSFDDCQDLVKAMFADAPFRDRHRLSAVNSINWARIAAQVVYYFAAAVALGAPDVPISFAVPTGNFGNVYAGHVARQMGLPVAELVIGTNRNDILYRFIETGRMQISSVEPSLSPSMDIQVSSNFERLLFEVSGRDGAALAAAMAAFRATGSLPASPETWAATRALIRAHRVGDDETRAMIAQIRRETGELLDPHSAIAVAASRAKGLKDGTPRVALACAHPAKFPDVVEDVTGIYPPLPAHLADLMTRPERETPIANDLNAVEAYVSANVTGANEGRA